jgi:putative spermidine/putrescine transport system permease protein
LFLVLVLIVPLGFLVANAFQSANGKTGVSQALSDPIFRSSLWRTFVLAAIVCALTLVLGTIYALAMAVAPKWLAAVLLIALFTIFWTSLLVRTYGWILLYLPKGPIYGVLHGLGLRSRPLAIFQTNLASYPAMVHVMMPYVVLPVFAATRQAPGQGPIAAAMSLVLLAVVVVVYIGADRVFRVSETWGARA